MSQNDGGQANLVANDLDLVIIDPDFRSDSLKVGLLSLHVGDLTSAGRLGSRPASLSRMQACVGEASIA